jgi:polyphosphate kinase
MDLESRSRWEAYTKAKEIMLERTHIPEAPWWVVEAVDKKRARLNCIAHLLTRVPYQEVPHQKPALPARVHNPDYHRHPVPHELYVPDHYANLAAEHAEHVEAEAQSAEVKASAAN